MKKILLLITTLSIIFLASVSSWGAPRLSVAQDTFIFEPTPEGTIIKHSFIINNTGDEPLIIKNILTG